jgi:hypothetical protein
MIWDGLKCQGKRDDHYILATIEPAREMVRSLAARTIICGYGTFAVCLEEDDPSCPETGERSKTEMKILGLNAFHIELDDLGSPYE